MSLFDRLPKGFHELPEELILKIVENLLDEDTPSNSGSPGQANKYKDLLTSCNLNSKCQRIGREVLFRHCDLAKMPMRQLCALLQTLLDPRSKDLRFTIRSLVLRWPVSAWGKGLRKFHNLEPFMQDILPKMMDYVLGADMPDHLRTGLLGGLELINSEIQPKAWYFVLILLLPNLRKLEIRSVRSNHMIDLLSLLREMRHCGMLQSLEAIVIQERTDIANTFHNLVEQLSAMQSIQLPKLESLELTPVADPGFTHRFPQEPPYIPSTQLQIENLKIGNHFPLERFDSFMSCFKGLRSLSITFSRRCFHSKGCDCLFRQAQTMWHELLRFKDSLEHLSLRYNRYKNTVASNAPESVYIWPRNLEQFTKLKSVEFAGGITFDPQVAWRKNKPELGDGIPKVIENFFPPNIEEFRLITDRIALGDTQHVRYWNRDKVSDNVDRHERLVNGRSHPISQPLHDFLQDIGTRRPSLKYVTVTSSLWPPNTFHKLQQRSKEEGVLLKMRSRKEERSEVCSGQNYVLEYERMFPELLQEVDVARAEALSEIQARDQESARSKELLINSVFSADLEGLYSSPTDHR